MVNVMREKIKKIREYYFPASSSYLLPARFVHEFSKGNDYDFLARYGYDMPLSLLLDIAKEYAFIVYSEGSLFENMTKEERSKAICNMAIDNLIERID